MRWDFKKRKIATNATEQTAYKNPLFSKKSWQIVVIENLGFFSWLSAFLLLLVIYLFLYSPIFQVKKIIINGAESSLASQIDQKFVRWQLDQRKWLFFKQKNIFLFDKKWLQENIEGKFSFNSILIDKKINGILIITVQEKIPTLLWKTNSEIYLLDENGTIAQKITAEEINPDYPIISDDSNSAALPGQQIISPTKAKFIKSLTDTIATQNFLETQAYSTPHPLSTEVDLKTIAGYKIIFDSSNEIEAQLTRLRRVLDESESGQSPTEYIDLRFGERVIIK